MKKYLVFVLCLIFAFALTACSDSSGDKVNESTQTSTSVENNTSGSGQVKESEPQLVLSSSINTKVVGVTFDNDDGTNRQDILEKIKTGDKTISLKRDPHNAYDKNAIEVHSNYGIVGFINADLAANLAAQMDSGKVVKATVEEITGGQGGYYYGCNILIEIYDQVK